MHPDRCLWLTRAHSGSGHSVLGRQPSSASEKPNALRFNSAASLPLPKALLIVHACSWLFLALCSLRLGRAPSHLGLGGAPMLDRSLGCTPHTSAGKPLRHSAPVMGDFVQTLSIQRSLGVGVRSERFSCPTVTGTVPWALFRRVFPFPLPFLPSPSGTFLPLLPRFSFPFPVPPGRLLPFWMGLDGLRIGSLSIPSLMQLGKSLSQRGGLIITSQWQHDKASLWPGFLSLSHLLD